MFTGRRSPLRVEKEDIQLLKVCDTPSQQEQSQKDKIASRQVHPSG